MTELHSKRKILVIDDEENLRHMLQVLLEKNGYQSIEARNGVEGLVVIAGGGVDCILCDIRMPELDGPGFLEQAVATGYQGTIIMMSAYGTIDTAVECMKKGAYDFISKPFHPDEILLALRKATERDDLAHENRLLRQAAGLSVIPEGIVWCSPKMRQVFTLVDKVASYKTSVLITGESGTGKELVARAIHSGSARNGASFIAVNCGAIPEHLLESELFGHTKGAFTDAGSDKTGLFEVADGGTLFLDEIGEMPSALQVKLLRVLQDEEIRRVGSSVSKKVDVRVVSATSRNLEQAVKEGAFREDLFFRLNVFSILLPPLRERPEDIPLLVEHFIAKYAVRHGLKTVKCSPDALRILLDYRWPGNVRELENAIERALVICEGDTLTVECLPDTVLRRPRTAVVEGLPADSFSLKRAEELVERELIRRALEQTSGNRTQAAKLLEISLRSLIYKIKEYGFE